MLAAVGTVRFQTVEAACHALVELGEAAYPSLDAQRYADAYERYRELYPALAPTFHAL
jgi:sugar (pentulose or hexulose) kinase